MQYISLSAFEDVPWSLPASCWVTVLNELFSREPRILQASTK